MTHGAPLGIVGFKTVTHPVARHVSVTFSTGAEGAFARRRLLGRFEGHLRRRKERDVPMVKDNLTPTPRRLANPESCSEMRLVVLTDAPLFRTSLLGALAQAPRYLVVGSAADEREAVAHIAALEPHAVLVDMTMPGSASAIRRILWTAPHVKVVALSVTPSFSAIASCVDAGASAYVGRGGTEQDLLGALDSLNDENVVWPPWMSSPVARWAVAESNRIRLDRGLTRRESEILEHVERGLSNKEIAGCLGIEVATVKNHVHNIRKKLVVRRRAALLPDIARAS